MELQSCVNNYIVSDALTQYIQDVNKLRYCCYHCDISSISAVHRIYNVKYWIWFWNLHQWSKVYDNFRFHWAFHRVCTDVCNWLCSSRNSAHSRQSYSVCYSCWICEAEQGSMQEHFQLHQMQSRLVPERLRDNLSTKCCVVLLRLT